MQLISYNDLELVLGYEFDAAKIARAEKIIEIVSGEVQAFCTAVTLEPVDGDIVHLRGTWNHAMKLPGAPIYDINSIDIDDEPVEDFDYTRHGLLINPSGWGGPHAVVTVDYDHGLQEVPHDVQSVVFSRAIRMFVNPHAVMQQKMGTDYSVSYAADAEMITGLNRSERRALAKYRKSVA